MKKKTTLSGVYTALVTPFNAQGHLDEEGLRKNIRFQIQNGVDGIVPLGTTGEAPTLTSKEEERVIRIAVEEAKGKVSILVGTGSYATEKTIENNKKAKDLGADMVLIVTPYYNKPTQEGIYRHFDAVAQAVSIPTVVYNIQGRTGQNIQTDTMQRLAAIPNIIGVKEASGNITQISDVIEVMRKANPNFSVMSGDDGLTFSLMALGGHGIISVVSNLFPKEIKELVTKLQHGDYEKAREIHFNFMPLVRGAFLETNPIPIKTAMGIRGMPSGECRLPLCEMHSETRKKLTQILDTYG